MWVMTYKKADANRVWKRTHSHRRREKAWSWTIRRIEFQSKSGKISRLKACCWYLCIHASESYVALFLCLRILNGLSDGLFSVNADPVVFFFLFSFLFFGFWGSVVAVYTEEDQCIVIQSPATKGILLLYFSNKLDLMLSSRKGFPAMPSMSLPTFDIPYLWFQMYLRFVLTSKACHQHISTTICTLLSQMVEVVCCKLTPVQSDLYDHFIQSKNVHFYTWSMQA